MSRMHRVITVACVLVGLLALAGIVSAFFDPGIQAALTVPRHQAPTTPANKAAMVNPPQQSNATPTAAHPTPAATPTPVMTMPTANVLAQDSFQRGDQRFWGTASGGQRWGAEGNNSPSFAITGHQGVIANGQGAFEATIGPQVADADVVFSGSVSRFGPGTSNIGAVLRWTDAKDWYKAYIDGAQFVLLKEVAGKITVLSNVAFAAQGGTMYTLRFRAVGTMLMAKVWLTGQAEPAAWMVTATDTVLATGFSGIRIVILDGAVVRFSMFEETAMANQQ